MNKEKILIIDDSKSKMASVVAAFLVASGLPYEDLIPIIQSSANGEQFLKELMDHKEWLTQHGPGKDSIYDIETCNAPEKAMQLLKENPYKAAIIDNHMMQKDGSYDFFATSLATLAKEQDIKHRLIYTAGHIEDEWKDLAEVRQVRWNFKPGDANLFLHPEGDFWFFVDWLETAIN